MSPPAAGVPGGSGALPVTVGTLTVPAGSYVIWATGQVNQAVGSDDYATCTLVGNGTTLSTEAMRPNSDTVADYSLMATTTFAAGGTIQLQCVGDSTSTLGPVLRNNNMVAMLVGGLN